MLMQNVLHKIINKSKTFLNSLFILNLQKLIVLLVFIGVISTLIISLISVCIVQKRMLMETAEQGNLAYSSKLAFTLDGFFRAAKRDVEYAASDASHVINNYPKAFELAESVRLEGGFFNSVGIVDKNNIITAVSPSNIHLISHNTQLDKSAYQLDKVSISPPLKSVAGNMIIMISAPIKNAADRFVGYLAGTIYLQKESTLTDMMQTHFHSANTSTFIITDGGYILYNSIPHSVETKVKQQFNAEFKDKNSGIMQITMDDGSLGIVGFAKVNATNWTVVTISTEKSITQSIIQVLSEIFKITLLPLLLTLALTGYIAHLIARPLHKLARCTGRMDDASNIKEINKIHAFYYEVYRLRDMIFTRFSSMHEKMDDLRTEANSDPLTGLFNRRSLSQQAELLFAKRNRMSLILIDVDNFKYINDHKGHDVGDKVLRCFAQKLRHLLPDNESIFRIGGDEFLIILPDTSRQHAVEMANVLLENNDYLPSEMNVNVTLSIGVTNFMTDVVPLEYAMKMVDIALYKSKNSGRARVTAIDL